MMVICSALALLALTAVSAPPAFSLEPNWVVLDENADSRFYYDQNGKKLSDNKPGEVTVQVRTRVVYSDEGKADALEILGHPKSLEKLFESRYRHDLNCQENESKLLEAAHLDGNGVTLKSTDLKAASEWEEIPPDARMGLVFERVCQ